MSTNDRYTRTMLTLIAVSTMSLALTSLWNALPVARAQSSPVRQKCIWTYIPDKGYPNIGYDGEVNLKGKAWKKVSDDGWKLAAISDGIFMFERCE